MSLKGVLKLKERKTHIVFLVPNLNPNLSRHGMIFARSRLKWEPLIDRVVVDEFRSQFGKPEETFFLDRPVVDLEDQR